MTIILFFIYMWGLGFTVTYSFIKSPSQVEKFFIRLGIGLGIFPILSIILNFLHIQLDWKIFLALSLAFPAFIIIKNLKNITFTKPKLLKSDLYLLAAVIIAVISLYIYATGAFSYPYLEDEDPWGHAVGAKYVAMQKMAYDPPLKNTEEIDTVLSYIDPYPPAYDILIGILHQTSSNLNWTIKFFNALIISLGFIFFFLFAKEFTASSSKALFATFVLAAIPSYLSHFIWAHSLVITLFFPALYALHKSLEDQKWLLPLLLIVASIWVTQNMEQPIKLTTMLLLYVVVLSFIFGKVYWKQITAILSGIATSFLWWGVMIHKYTFSVFQEYYGGTKVQAGETLVLAGSEGQFSILNFLKSVVLLITNPGGSASRPYTLSDFFFAKGENMINNPIGVGSIVSLLALVGIILILWRYRSRLVAPSSSWQCVAIFWLIYTFWGINGMTFPISVARAAFRVWPLLAISLAFIIAEGVHLLLDYFAKNKFLQKTILVFAIIGIVLTSGIAKYELNTAVWPTSGSFISPAIAVSYGTWFSTIPDDTSVFLYAPRDKLVIGFGKFSCLWCQEVIDFREGIVNASAEELYNFLKRNNYQYLILSGPMDLRYFENTYHVPSAQEVLQKKYTEIVQTNKFSPAYKADAFAVLEVI